MICLQPFTPIYTQGECEYEKKSLSPMLTSRESAQNTTVSSKSKNSSKLYMNRYSIDESKKCIETDCSNIKYAIDTNTGAKVVLKFIKDSEWAQRELEIMNILNKNKIPNVITLEDTFIDGETNMRVLVFKRYHTIEKTGNNLIDIQRIIKQLFNALYMLHNLNIVHLDITLSNLMLDDNNDLVIIDFGLARICDRKSHPIGCGTPGFIAPEVYFGESVDTKPDIYSAGVVFGMLLEPFIHNCSLEDLGCRLARHSTTSLVQDKIRENYLFERYHYSSIPEIIFDAADLLVMCIEYDSCSRISSMQAIRHPFLTKDASHFKNTEYLDYATHPLKKIPSKTVIFYRS